MGRPCVRVNREEGERTRRLLEEIDLRDGRYAIVSDEEHVYIPVTDATTVEGRFTVIEQDVPRRETHTLPEDLLDFAPTYEHLGDLALLQEDDPDRAHEAADAIMASDLPVSGVLHRTSEVRGQTRVPEWDVLAGETTETIHREFGAEFLVDPTRAYFSPRLATERQRVVEQVTPGEHVLDMFAGVGPFAIRAAIAGATVLAVDINPDAIACCRENARSNDVDDRVTVIEGDVRDVVDEFPGWADRLYMNLPHSAEEYLPAARTAAGDTCRLHYYDIQPVDAPFDAGEGAIRDTFEDAFEVVVADRRIVRSYAADQVNVCLDVDVTRRTTHPSGG